MYTMSLKAETVVKNSGKTMWSNILFMCLLSQLNIKTLGEQYDSGKTRKSFGSNQLKFEPITNESLEGKTGSLRSEESTLLKLVPQFNSSKTKGTPADPTDLLFQDEIKLEEVVLRIARNLDELLTEPEIDSTAVWEGRGKKKRKYKKGEMQFLAKALLGLKVALLGIVLPLGVIVAKVLSWKAVTLSLMAFMLAKIVFVKNLFMGKSSTTPTTSQPASPPIVIHSSAPPHEHVWKRQSEPQIHVKPEVHVHQSEEQFHGWDDSYSNRNWQWGRDNKGNHELVYRNWIHQKR